jgi:hypothetical protein
MIENVYRLQVMNTAESAQQYRISVAGIDTIKLATTDIVSLQSTETRAIPIRVRVDHGKGKPGSNRIQVTLISVADPSISVTEKAVFIVPR